MKVKVHKSIESAGFNPVEKKITSKSKNISYQWSRYLVN